MGIRYAVMHFLATFFILFCLSDWANAQSPTSPLLTRAKIHAELGCALQPPKNLSGQ